MHGYFHYFSTIHRLDHLLRTSIVKQINKVVVKAIHMHTVHSSVKEQVMSFDVTIKYMQQCVCPWRPRAGKHSHMIHTQNHPIKSTKREKEVAVLLTLIDLKLNKVMVNIKHILKPDLQLL